MNELVSPWGDVESHEHSTLLRVLEASASLRPNEVLVVCEATFPLAWLTESHRHDLSVRLGAKFQVLFDHTEPAFRISLRSPK